MAEEKKLLEIENLRKYFPVNGIKGPGVQAVQDVSLYIKERFFAFMSQPEERLFMMAKPFTTILWIKTANLLEKPKLPKCFPTEEKCRSFSRIRPLPWILE